MVKPTIRKISGSSTALTKAARMGQGTAVSPIPTVAPTSAGSTGGLTAAAKSAFSEAEQVYQPDGSFTAGVESALSRAQQKFMSSGMQNLVSAGLANTSMVGNLAGKFTEEVAAPTLAGAESERVSNLANLKLALAQAEQGAYESSAGRDLSREQLAASTGLGYAQLGEQTASRLASTSLGRAQLATSTNLSQQGLNLETARLKADIANQKSLTSLYNTIRSQQAPSLY